MTDSDFRLELLIAAMSSHLAAGSTPEAIACAVLDLCEPLPLIWEEGRANCWRATGTGYQIAHNEGESWRVRLHGKVICASVSGHTRARIWAQNHRRARHWSLTALERMADARKRETSGNTTTGKKSK